MAGRLLAQGPSPLVRLVPRTDLVNVLEYEAQASLRLPPSTFARVTGGDRSVFDRITLRPRMLVPTRGLDLGISLFGDLHLAPIIAGPVGGLTTFADDGEAALIEGASAAGAAVVLASGGAHPIDALVARARTPVWAQVFASESSATDTARRAVAGGCRVVCVTIGAVPASGGVRAAGIGARDWRAVSAIATAAGVPVVVKGVTSPAAARQAVTSGAAGIVYSDYGGLIGGPDTASILNLPGVVDAAGERIPVLADGGFRRGTDIVKALALGAAAVLVARPVVWGLSAYGAPGVQGVLEMLQTELARYMAMCGRPGLKTLDASVLRVHEART